MSRIAFARFLSKYLYFSPKGSKISLQEVSGWVWSKSALILEVELLLEVKLLLEVELLFDLELLKEVKLLI